MTAKEPPKAGRRRWPSRLGLGGRLALILLPLVLIPLILMATGAYLRAREILRQQATTQILDGIDSQTEYLITWASQRETNLFLSAQDTTLHGLIAEAAGSDDPRSANALRRYLRGRLAPGASTHFSDLMLVELGDDGLQTIWVATNPDWESRSLQSLNELAARQAITQPVTDIPELGSIGPSFVSIVPLNVETASGKGLALVGINRELEVAELLKGLQSFWEKTRGMRGGQVQTALLLAPDIVITLPGDALFPEAERGLPHPVFSTAQQNEPAVLEYDNLDGVPVIGGYRWFPEWQMALAVELPQDVVFGGLNSLAPFTLALLGAAILMTALIVPLVARRSLRPLGTLAALAERFASGDLSARVEFQRTDEIGRLARAFNFMADELGQLYHSLEERVRQRTRDILLTAEVAKDAAAVREVERLLEESVDLISRRFGFYHVGIFLLDEKGKYAELRAASSEGGKHMLRRGHKLAVGKTGIVGFVTGTGRARIALDVGDDAVHFANPDLPKTRSELAVPLKVSGKVIGALDVQSEQPAAFSETDVTVLQIMADQLAVAIENTRLLERANELSEQRRKVIEVYGYLGRETDYDKLIKEVPEALRRAFGFQRVTLGLIEGEEVVVRSVAEAPEADYPSPVETTPIGQGLLGRTALLKSAQQVTHLPFDEMATQDPRKNVPQNILALPLTVRDQVIGTMAFESGGPGETDSELVETLRLVVAQVAVALENARLMETMRQNLEQMDALYRQQTAEGWAHLLARHRHEGETSVVVGSGGEEADLPAIQAPLTVRGETIGELELRGAKMGGWTDEDRAIVQEVAEEVADALEQARLTEEIHRRAAYLQAAAEVARSSSALMDLETLLSKAVHLIREHFGFYYVAVFLINESGEMAVLQEATGEAGQRLKANRHQLPVGSKSIIGLVSESGEPYIAHQARQDPYFWPNPLLPETRAEMGIPMKAGERVIGVLDVQHTRAHAFSEEDATVLQTLADQLAVAVQNARLFQQTLEQAEREKMVADISRRIRASGSLDTLLQTALREMRSALGAGKARIQLAPQEDESGEDGRDAPP